MKDIIIKSIKLSVLLLIICGVLYPLVTTGASQLLFNGKANGSIVTFNGKEVGSSLIGQNFTDPRFFRGRVSAINYNTYKAGEDHALVTSGSQNLGPSSDELTARVKKDMDEFLKNHPGVKKEEIPTDLLTSSGSGLDPEISPAAAKIQINAVANASGISAKELEKFIEKYTTGKTIGVIGEERVNVLMLNLEIANVLKIFSN